ncbi:uncharacterized protein LOC104882576 [Vitis vinifera]|uniref:Uncharacterized protein n=1 Tax=Vitis vinifera TaxID=29760 RepID=F6H086_VITVI|nr:uncharacterized protein LOC104882576 [Vitis vinifera]|eukprot:XP_010664809.1 PREDICTED: uncharacterized protein LOC104882576 [Vitis vinifera]
MIALHFPVVVVVVERMYRPQRESFAIQVRAEALELPQPNPNPSSLNFSAMKLFHRFRKILMRFFFSFPSRAASSATTSSALSRQKAYDKPDPPKTSCSSYYSSNSHYTEAIADCIEFFNKEGILDGRKSDVVV